MRYTVRVIWVDFNDSLVIELTSKEVRSKTRLANKLIYLSDFCGNALLIVGRGPLHGLIFNQLAKQEKYRTVSPLMICGAGHIKDGEIVDWTSSGFGVTTPVEIRADITKVLTS